MLFPLGLGSRLPTSPLMCLILTLTIVGYSVASFPVIRAFDQRVKSALGQQDVRGEATAFFRELCTLRLQDPVTCAGFAASLQDRKKKPDMPDSLETARRLLAVTDEFSRGVRQPSSVTDPQVRDLPSFQRLSAFDAVRRAQSASISRDLGLLTGGNHGFLPLLKAQFSHAGWMHLISNLLVLVLLGIYVEARAGAIWFTAIFLASGIFGMLGHLWLNSDPSRPLLGASAGVAGMMGAFLAFFWRQPMKVALIGGVLNRVIYIPSWLILGPLFIAHDVTGALSTDDGVAHVAHLSGLIVGLALGLLQKRLAPVPAGMLYDDEAFFTAKLPEIAAPAKRLEIAERVLSWNPSNLPALRASVLTRVELPFDFEPPGLAEPLTSYLAITLREGARDEAYSLLSTLPRRVPLADQIVRLSLKNRLILAEHALTHGDWLTAVRVYDSALVRELKPGMRENIVQSVEQLRTHVNPAPDDLKDLRLSSELKYKFSA